MLSIRDRELKKAYCCQENKKKKWQRNVENLLISLNMEFRNLLSILVWQSDYFKHLNASEYLKLIRNLFIIFFTSLLVGYHWWPFFRSTFLYNFIRNEMDVCGCRTCKIFSNVIKDVFRSLG